VCLSTGWAWRAVAAQIDLRHAAEAVRVEWAHVDRWLQEQDVVGFQIWSGGQDLLNIPTT